MGNNVEDEVEIDLFELLLAVKQHILAVIITGLAGGIAALAISMFLITPVYTSTSKILVLTKETTLASLADIQMGSQLTNDYQVLILSRPVLEDVIFNLNLDVTYTQLARMVSISNPDNTRIIELSVNNSDPVLAMDIVNELARISSEFIGDKMEVVPPKIIEEGIIPIKRTSPNHRTNLILGVLAGVVVSGGIICLIAIMDDSIKSEDDIWKYLDIPMLASVPDRKDYINVQKEKQKKERKKREGKK